MMIHRRQFGRRNRCRCLAICCFLLGCISCAHAPKPSKVVPGIARKSFRFSVQVNVADDANQNSPVPVDFVMVADKKLLPEIAKFSARDWFERRGQLARDFPSKVKIISWEWVPGYHVGPINIEVAPGTRGGFLFANYMNNGEHRAYVDVRLPIALNLGTEEFGVQPLR